MNDVIEDCQLPIADWRVSVPVEMPVINSVALARYESDKIGRIGPVRPISPIREIESWTQYSKTYAMEFEVS